MKLVLNLLAAVSLFVPLANAAEPIVIDGEFDDWDASDIVAVDPAGDATGAFDITHLYARSNGAVVSLRFDTGIVKNIQSGPAEEGTLVFRFVNSRTNREMTIDTRARSVMVRGANGEQAEIGWHGADYRSAPTYAHHEFEIRADLTPLGVQNADTIRLTVSGSDSLDEPIEISIGEERSASVLKTFDLSRADGTIIRAASLNTLRNGIVDEGRSDALLRLLASSAPDVILIQEEYNTSAEDVRARLTAGLGGEWNIAKVRDTVVASRFPVRKLQSLDDSYTAAIVETPTHGPALVFSVHPKCCGTIGSEEDQQRIRQTRAMIQTVEIARSRFGSDLPILLAGDWNMVGSRSPLDLLTNPVGPRLAQVELRQRANQEVYTWYAPESSFSPGVLDLAAVDEYSSSRSAGFLIDTRRIEPELLKAVGLRSDDSAASDHLLMVVDLARDDAE